MKSCVIFAVSIFSEHKLYVLREFLDTFSNNFKDCDFYIGINYGSISYVENVILDYNFNLKMERLNDSNLYCKSDASVYQLALRLLKESGNSYDMCWFAHTKGGVNERDVERNIYIKDLYEKRYEIENFFNINDNIGSYGLRGLGPVGAGGDVWANFNNDHHIEICSNKIVGDLKYTHVNWSYIDTMYVIKGSIVNYFLQISPINFYKTKINEPCYFEVIFPWIASRCGYFPYVKQEKSYWGDNNLKNITNEWIEENNLFELKKYLLLSDFIYN